MKDAGVLTRAHEEFQLLGRVQRVLRGARLEADCAQNEIAEAVEGEDRRTEEEEKDRQRAHDPEGRGFALLERETLGRELPDHDVQRRDDDEGKGDGDGVRTENSRRSRQEDEQRLDQMRERRLADPPEREGGDGDAELRRRQIGVEAVDRALQRGGVHAPQGDEFGDAAAADGDQRELGGDKESIGQDEDENCGYSHKIGGKKAIGRTGHGYPLLRHGRRQA